MHPCSRYATEMIFQTMSLYASCIISIGTVVRPIQEYWTMRFGNTEGQVIFLEGVWNDPHPLFMASYIYYDPIIKLLNHVTFDDCSSKVKLYIYKIIVFPPGPPNVYKNFHAEKSFIIPILKTLSLKQRLN